MPRIALNKWFHRKLRGLVPTDGCGGYGGIVVGKDAKPNRMRFFSLVLGLAAGASLSRPAEANSGYYGVDLTTPTMDFSAVDSNLSISQTGLLAFAATDAKDGLSKLFVSPCAPPLCSATPVSFFGSGRLFLGAAINNATPPSVLSVDRFSGSPPSFFLRTWNTASPGSFSLVGKTPDPNIGVFTSYFGLSDQGRIVDTAATASNFTPELLFYDTPGGAAMPLIFPSGTLLRPQMAKGTSDVVLTYQPSGTSGSILVYGYPGRTPRFVAGASNGFTNTGQKAGISDDGKVVGFYGTANKANQIVVEIGYPATVSNGSVLNRSIAMVAAEGNDGVTSLAASATNRISVYSKSGPPYLDPLGVPHYFQLVSVVFAGTVAVGTDPALPGLFSRDLLVEVTADDSSSTSANAFKVLAKGAILPIARAGDSFSSVALASGFTPSDTVATFATGNTKTPEADLKIPILAFAAADAAGHNYALRAIRSCAIPSTPVLPDLKQTSAPWATATLGFSPMKNKIKAAGCRLTDISDILAFYFPISAGSLTPDNVNELLKQVGFTYSSGQISFPGTTTLKVMGFSGGDVATQGVEALSGLIASLNGGNTRRLNNIARSVGVSETGFFYTVGKTSHFDAKGHLVGLRPTETSNINSTAMSPYIDFFECNQEPLIIKVLHCNAKSCSKHFVVGTGKDAAQVKSRPAKNVSSAINDPGFRFNPPKDLINTFSGNHYLNTSLGVESYTRAAVAGSGGDTLSITAQSPVTMLLTDPDGRKIGIDPSSGTGISMIPNASFVDNSFDDPGNVGVVEDATEIVVGGPADVDGNVVAGSVGNGALDGAYQLDVVGTGTGPYTIQVTSVDKADNGSTASVTANTVPGQHDIYTITRTGTVGVPVTLH